MTLAKAVLPLLEALDDSDGSIDALQVCSPRRAARPSCSSHASAQHGVTPLPRAAPSCSHASAQHGVTPLPRAAPSCSQAIVQDEYKVLLEAKLGEMRRAKLGLAIWDAAAQDELWPTLQRLLTQSGCDYTIYFRQLACISLAEATHVAEAHVSVAEEGEDVREAAATAPPVTSVAERERSAVLSEVDERQMSENAAAVAATAPMLMHLLPCFFDGAPTGKAALEWAAWLRAYAQRLIIDGRDDKERQAEMRATSPKYVPREWILAQAYTKAQEGDLSVLNELIEVFATPFDEHSEEIAARYYRLPPKAMQEKAGVSYFS